MMKLSGTSSDDLPDVLATGTGDISQIFVSMSARETSGRDLDYLVWHSLDHRPEQYRIAGLRHSIRLVSTPACRAARLAANARYAAVDHVMTYFFAAGAALEQFTALSQALQGERRPVRLPSVFGSYFKLSGKAAAGGAVAGADVIPFRPARGVFLLLERGATAPAGLADIDGVAGVWWHRTAQPATGPGAPTDLQLTYLFLEDDPVATVQALAQPLRRRWQSGGVVPLLAAPFYTLVPFEWDRYLP